MGGENNSINHHPWRRRTSGNLGDNDGRRSRTLKPKRERRLRPTTLLGGSQSVGGWCQDSGPDLPPKRLHVNRFKKGGSDRLRVDKKVSPISKLGGGGGDVSRNDMGKISPIVLSFFCSPQGTRGWTRVSENVTMLTSSDRLVARDWTAETTVACRLTWQKSLSIRIPARSVMLIFEQTARPPGLPVD